MNGQSAVWGTSLLAGLKAISGNSPDAAGQAAIYFRDHFERCDTSVSSCADRASVGASEFKKLVGNNPNASSGSSGSSTYAKPKNTPVFTMSGVEAIKDTRRSKRLVPTLRIRPITKPMGGL
jgi:hypothetical protein